RCKALTLVKALDATWVGKNFAFGNTGTRFVRSKLFVVQELDGMCRHHRQAKFGRQLRRLSHMRFHIRLTSTLHLDIEMTGKQSCPALRGTLSSSHIAIIDGNTDITEMRSRQHDQMLFR